MPVISLKPKEEEKPKEKSQGLILGVVLVVVVLLVLGVVWGGIYYYKILEQKKIVSLDEEINTLNSEMEKYKEVQSKNKVLRKQIENIQELLAGHVCWSEFFENLEDLTVKEVYFVDFTGDITAGTITLRGRTTDYTTLGEQLAVFRESPLFTGFQINQARVISEGDKNYVEFDAELSLKDKALLCEEESK